jgi:hypothetical protein
MINHYARAGSFTTKVGSPGKWAEQLPTPTLGLAVLLLALLVSKREFPGEQEMISAVILGIRQT